VLLDVGRRQVLAEADTDGSAVQTLAFARAGDRLACGTAGGRSQLWRGDVLAPLDGWPTGTAVNALVLVEGTDLLAVGGQALRFWQVSGQREVLAVEVPSGRVRCLGLSAAGDELLVAEDSPTVRVLDLEVVRRQLRRLGLDLPETAHARP
jgi:WD40 repeat protein